MDLNELIKGLDVRVTRAGATPSVRVCDLTEDSRTVVPGSLFVARSGTRDDGRKYVADAIRAGAAAVLAEDGSDSSAPSAIPVVLTKNVAQISGQIAERFYGNPSKKLKLAGVTGTNGKTTTTWLAWQILNHAGVRTGLIGTCTVDDGRECAPAHMTTLPAIETSRALSTMLEGGCTACVMETSSHSLDQHRVTALDFDVAVFTNLTGDHLDYHKTMEHYAGAKASLFALLPSSGVAIVNAEDEHAAEMVKNCKARVISCKVGENADASIQLLSTSLQQMHMELDGPWGKIQTTLALIGRYNLMNALQAATICHEFGLTADQIAAGMAAATAPPGRLERVSIPNDEIVVLVDYAHTDDGLKNAVHAVREAMKASRHSGRLICIFGCGGDRDATKRPRMGRVASDLSDEVVITSDNPRREKPGAIIDQILAGIDSNHRQHVRIHEDRATAISTTIDEAREGDVIIIAGKGHETYQILPDGKGGTRTIHFDDREVARAALQDRRAAHSQKSDGKAGKP